MPRELEKHQLLERSLIKKFRRELWNPFVAAVKNYQLIDEGDRVAVIVTGSAKSAVLAMLIKQLNRVSDFPFEYELIACSGARDVEKLSADFQLEIKTVNEDYLSAAGMLDCNKIAIDFTGTQAVLTLIGSMFFGHRLQTVLPKERAGEQQIIRPLYCVFDDAIKAFERYNDLSFIPDGTEDERAERLLSELKEKNPDAEKNIFKSLHAVCLETLPGYWRDGEYRDFNSLYAER